jgi:hypothetical protein
MPGVLWSVAFATAVELDVAAFVDAPDVVTLSADVLGAACEKVL